MEMKSTYIGTMIGLATVAFGLIAAGAWNKFISDLIALFLKPGSGLAAQFIYAVIVTVIAIVVVQSLARLAQKDGRIVSRINNTRATAAPST
jgi:TRAP-type C4-dicarboxylate transport system permease small subunit